MDIVFNHIGVVGAGQMGQGIAHVCALSGSKVTLLDINEKTVSTYKARLFKKLNVTNLIDLVNQGKQLDIA